jgi:hypothetical protein
MDIKSGAKKKVRNTKNDEYSMLVCWYVGMLVWGNVGMLVCWFIEKLDHWFVGMLVF